MLFLGLGTGLGSALIVDGIVEPMELGHLPYKKGTYEDYVGMRGLERRGKKKWRQHVADVVARLIAALEPDDVVLGGGNVKKLKELPPGCRRATTPMRSWEDFACGKKARSSSQDLVARQTRMQAPMTEEQPETHASRRPAIAPLTERPAWKALEAHHQEVSGSCICASSSRTTPSAASA